MKTMVLIFALVCLPLFAEGKTSEAESSVAIKAAILKRFEGQIRPILETLSPAPIVEYLGNSTSLRVAYLPQTFTVHARNNRTGEFSQATHEEVGPSFKGFVFVVRFESKEIPQQLALPFLSKEAYWSTYADLVSRARATWDIGFLMSYGTHTDMTVVGKLQTTLKELEFEK